MNLAKKKVKKLTKPAPVVLKIWDSSEMAEIWIGKSQEFVGNFWDYHPGCHGTKFKIKGKTLDVGKDWKGPHSLAYLLANLIGTSVKVEKIETEWTD